MLRYSWNALTIQLKNSSRQRFLTRDSLTLRWLARNIDWQWLLPKLGGLCGEREWLVFGPVGSRLRLRDGMLSDFANYRVPEFDIVLGALRRWLNYKEVDFSLMKVSPHHSNLIGYWSAKGHFPTPRKIPAKAGISVWLGEQGLEPWPLRTKS